MITNKGYYKVRKHDEVDGWTSLTEWAESDAINQGTDVVNRLRIECQGETLRFYANDTLLIETSDASFGEGQVGLSTGSYQEGPDVHVVFDNIVIYDLD